MQCVLQDNFPDEQSCLRCDGNELKCTKCELHHGLMSPTYCQKVGSHTSARRGGQPGGRRVAVTHACRGGGRMPQP